MADVNNTLKTLGAGLVGMIPKYGAFISSIFSLLWPDSEIDYWAKVKEKVYAAIEKALNKAKVEQLKELLQGTKDNFQEYVATTDPGEKNTRCVAIDVVLTELKHQFMDESLDSVVYFVQFAALHIAINVELAIHYDDEKNRQDLKNLVDEYSAYAHKMSPKLVQFRLGQIDTSCCFDIRDPLVIKHNKMETIGSGYGMYVIITSYGVAQDNHLRNKDLVFDAFMTSECHYGGAPINKEISGGRAKSESHLGEYRARIKLETEAYWKENLIDPIDVYKDAKILEPLH
jgi:hypothetical protein